MSTSSPLRRGGSFAPLLSLLLLPLLLSSVVATPSCSVKCDPCSTGFLSLGQHATSSWALNTSSSTPSLDLTVSNGDNYIRECYNAQSVVHVQ